MRLEDVCPVITPNFTSASEFIDNKNFTLTKKDYSGDSACFGEPTSYSSTKTIAFKVEIIKSTLGSI